MTEVKIKTRTGYELHPRTLEDFFELLERREEEEGPDGHPFHQEVRTTPRRAVYATALTKPISNNLGVPAAQRWLQAQFIYGDYLVTYKRYTHHGYEMHPGNGSSPEEEEWRARWLEFRTEVYETVEGYFEDRISVLEMHITREST